jgi:hypothetical protein
VKVNVCNWCVLEGRLTPSRYRWPGGVHGCADHAKANKRLTREQVAKLDVESAAKLRQMMGLEPLPAPPEPGPGSVVAPPDPALSGKGFGGFSVRVRFKRMGHEGEMFEAVLLHRGINVADVSNDGNGGFDRFDWRANKSVQDAFAALAKERHPEMEYEAEGQLLADMITAVERRKWTEKQAKAGRSVCYELVLTAWDYGSALGVTPDRVQMNSFQTEEQAAALLAKGAFVGAHRILNDGTLGPETKGTVKPRGGSGDSDPPLTNGAVA